MLKCLIVDDEYISREGLIDSLEWAEFEITIVGAAQNGVEGLRLFEEHRPDIVVTDVKMPLMDGLSMTKEIMNIDPTTKIILLSAYGEFSYAQEAIKYGVSYYLLKPADEEELRNTIQEVIEEIRVSQALSSDKQITELFTAQKYVLCKNEELFIRIGDKDLFFEKMIVAQGFFRSKFIQIYVIPQGRMYPMLETLSKGFYSLSHQDENLVEAYNEANKAFRSANFWQVDKETFHNVDQQWYKWKKSAKMRNDTIDMVTVTLLENTSGNRLQHLVQTLEGFIRVLKQFCGIDKEQIYFYCYELIHHLDERFFLFNDQNEKQRFKEHLYQNEVFEDLTSFLKREIIILFDTNELSPTDNKIISKVKNIVHEQYMENIGSKSIAEQIFLSPNYMGQLFKEVTGKYLNDYILEVRMKEAKKKLIETDKSLSVIAEEVGTSSQAYFTSLFKKVYQMTPKEYRRKIKKI